MSTHIDRQMRDERRIAVQATRRSPRRRVTQVIGLTVAVLAAGVAGIATVASVADDPAPPPISRVVEPNPNQREGRVPTADPGGPALIQPNPNQREGRVPDVR